jgi:putative ABC transport system permease protein
MSIFRFLSDIPLAFDNLRAQKTRTVLTALGIVFGVGSVIGMLAIGAGAREESLSFIERLGVRNVLVDSIPAASREEMQQRRRSSPGLTERDVRILEANVESLEIISPRRTLHPARVLPKPSQAMPNMNGVRPTFSAIHNLRVSEGRFFTPADDLNSAQVCVLGDKVKVSLLGYGPGAAGKYIKVNDTWLEVVGVLAPMVGSGIKAGAQAEDRNNFIYVPFNTYQYRFWDSSAFMKDELDGIDIRLKTGADSVRTAEVVTAILNSTHRNVEDFTVTIPAALLAQQQKTQTIFTYVMVAIAAISLLVGGIGIMNIMLVSVRERTREIGLRKALGAREGDILTQFMIEALTISLVGALIGLTLGVLIAVAVNVTGLMAAAPSFSAAALAVGFAMAIGLFFGIAPARSAARLDPIDALRYE